jgi:hypothetical protein
MGRARAATPVAETSSRGRTAEHRRLAGIIAFDVWDPKLQSRRCLDAMSRGIDAWLRSAAFLELMQQGLKTAIAARRLYAWWAPRLPIARGAGPERERRSC